MSGPRSANAAQHPPHQTPHPETPAHIQQVLQAAQDRLERIKAALQPTKPNPQPTNSITQPQEAQTDLRLPNNSTASSTNPPSRTNHLQGPIANRGATNTAINPCASDDNTQPRTWTSAYPFTSMVPTNATNSLRTSYLVTNSVKMGLDKWVERVEYQRIVWEWENGSSWLL